ncbi:MAG TPA: hypothetical protein DEQ38_08830 [Elusimicrobia bacterium]|nr:MAG: hypothetical protein A2089_10435 [Elusimicrobia bacterium GWD2_63_28]HCC48198.1 hypothetical protein [Elusimicrobiota bacterium]
MTKPLTLTLLFLSSALFAGQASGPSYLLLSHDPAFLEEVSKISEPVYAKGRARLVRFTVPSAEIPPDIAALVRQASLDEIYSAPAAAPKTKTVDPAVLALTSKVSGARLMGYAEALVMTGKRSAGQLDLSPASGNRLAMDYIANAFKEMGYEVERQCYKDRKADKECNIIARRKAGQAGAKAILVVGHMDSVGHDKAGADDNASGSAGVLEMARILSGYKADHDLIFVTANGEENGIAGSYACAKKLKASGELSSVAWAINMDMIAWNRDGIIEIETNKEFSAYADWVAGQAAVYTKLKPYIAMPAWGSDHVPFLEAGIPTYLSIEHWEDHNPCYHKACDKMDTLSWTYAADIVRLNLAVIAGKAKLTPIQ